jgi:hypothetical protein
MGTAKNVIRQSRGDVLDQMFHPIIDKKLLTGGGTVGVPVTIGSRTWIFPKPWHDRQKVENNYSRHMQRSPVPRATGRKDSNTGYVYDPEDFISD